MPNLNFAGALKFKLKQLQIMFWPHTKIPTPRDCFQQS